MYTEGTELPRGINPTTHKDIVEAYAICLKCEEELIEEQKAGKDVKRELIDCRIVGYLFHHGPTNEALETVINEVLACANRKDILRLGRMYFDYLLKPFYEYIIDYYETFVSKAKSPPPFKPVDDVAQRVMNRTSQNTTTAHNKALVRDGFSCILSGSHDMSCMRKSKELRNRWPDSEFRDWKLTTCVYIMREIHSGFNEKQEDITSVHSVLRRFGYENLLAEINGAGFHRLENILTIACDIRQIFDEMLVWFVETTKPHTYEVKTCTFFRKDPFPFREMYGLPDYVTFTTPDEDKLPLPSPSYLRLHAAICEIGDLSGATEYMREFCDDLGILAKDELE